MKVVSGEPASCNVNWNPPLPRDTRPDSAAGAAIGLTKNCPPLAKPKYETFPATSCVRAPHSCEVPGTKPLMVTVVLVIPVPKTWEVTPPSVHPQTS